MAEVRQIRIEDENNNIYYPHNTADVTFLKDGKTLQEFLDNGGEIGGAIIIPTTTANFTPFASKRVISDSVYQNEFGTGSDGSLVLRTLVDSNDPIGLLFNKNFFIPTSNTNMQISLGSATNRWGNLYLKQKVQSGTDYLELTTESEFGVTIDNNGKRMVPKANKNMDLGADAYRFKDLWLGNYSKATSGYDTLPNGFLIQWVEVDVNFSTAQAQDISITMPMGFTSGGAFGFANCIANSTLAKYTTTAVTTANSLTGSFLLRVASTQTISTTLKFKVFAIGY